VTAAIQAAEARIAELRRLEQQVLARSAAAAIKLAEAEADERKHADLLTGAEEAYSAEPTDSNAAAIGKAREALNLAKLRVRAPRAEHEAAQAALAAWHADVDAAGAAVRRASLEHRASLDMYNRRTAAAFKTLLGALAAVRNAAAEIDQAFEDANAAARELGEAELSVFHRISPLLRSAAAVHGAEGLVNRGNFYKAAGGCAHGLARALPMPLLDAIEVAARDRGVVHGDAAKVLLERVLACRTGGEGDELIKEAEKGAAIAAPAPQPDRSPWLAEQARLRKEGGDDELRGRANSEAAPAQGLKAASVDTLDDVAHLFGAETTP
jgi:hypothetical protein